MFLLLKSVDHVVAQFKELVSPKVVQYDVEHHEGDQEATGTGVSGVCVRVGHFCDCYEGGLGYCCAE